MDFQDDPSTGSQGTGTNPFNRNILKGGKVDPKSKLYQRSVAGREQLKDYLSRLWNDGGDEADVFMAGVKSLVNRGHGYVGAYLDSKNPERRYTDNQAKAIVDQVMEDEGIGDHPGARLTRPKVEDEEGNVDKEATKAAREERKQANVGRGGYGPKQAPGKKAMSVGQQRKQGKRESTGEALKDSRRDGLGMPDKGPVSEWQKTLKDRLKGEASTQDVLAAFQKQYQSQIGGKKKAAPGEGAPGPSEAPGQPPTGGGAAPEEKEDMQTREEGPVIPINDAIFKDISSTFARDYNDFRQNLIEAEKNKFKGVWDKKKETYIQPDDNRIRGMIDEAIGDAQEKYGNIDSKSAKSKLRKRLMETLGIDPYEGEPEEPVQEEKTAATKEEVPQPEAAPDRQTQATDDNVMRRATLLGDKKPAPTSQVKYKNPNIEEEWNEAARYPEFETAGIEAWSDAVKNGKPTKFSQLGDVNNVDLNYDSLDEGKKNNFQRAFKDGVIETPIVGRFEDGSYELIAGNTRLSGLVKNGVDPTVMVVDFPSGEGEEEAPATAAPASRGGGGGRSKPAGFFDYKPGVKDALSQAVSEGKSPQEVVEQFKQSDLFGKTGFETEGSDNPLGDQAPDPYEKFRGQPGKKPLGAQAGGREPATSGRGKPGQQSVFKMKDGKMGTDPRADISKKPEKPTILPPQKAPQTQQERADRLKDLESQGLTSDQAYRQAVNEGSINPRGAKGKNTASQQQQQTNPAPRKKSLLDQVARGVMGAGNAINKARERHNKSAGGRLFQVSEKDQGMQMSYEEFSQSIRAMMR